MNTRAPIYVYYGNASAVDQQNKTGVWDSHYKSVYHLADNAANTTTVDSTSSGLNAAATANTSTLYTSSGQAGGAQTYSGDNLANTSNSTLNLASFTISLWWNYQSVNNLYGGPMSYRVSGKSGFMFVNEGRRKLHLPAAPGGVERHFGKQLVDRQRRLHAGDAVERHALFRVDV